MSRDHRVWCKTDYTTDILDWKCAEEEKSDTEENLCSVVDVMRLIDDIMIQFLKSKDEKYLNISNIDFFDV